MRIIRLVECAHAFRRRRFRNAVPLLSARVRLEAAFPDVSAVLVLIALENKRPPRVSVRTADSTRQQARCAQLRVLDRAPTREASAAGTQAWRAAPIRGTGGRFFREGEALRVIRIPHFAGPRAKKSDFVSTVSHGAIAVKHFRVRTT